MKQVIVVTGASSGFGALAARALANAGHTVYASMRETRGRNAAIYVEQASAHFFNYVQEDGGRLQGGEVVAMRLADDGQGA